MELLQSNLYTPEAVARLVGIVNSRLTGQRPDVHAERERLGMGLQEVQQRLTRLRQFVEGGDTSGKVREWLAEAEQDERRLRDQLQKIESEARRPPLQAHPQLVERYLRDLRDTLGRSSQRARQALQADVERIVVHPVRDDKAKPFASAEVITTGKGLLDRVAFVVAGAGFEPATFGL